MRGPVWDEAREPARDACGGRAVPWRGKYVVPDVAAAGGERVPGRASPTPVYSVGEAGIAKDILGGVVVVWTEESPKRSLISEETASTFAPEVASSMVKLTSPRSPASVVLG